MWMLGWFFVSFDTENDTSQRMDYLDLTPFPSLVFGWKQTPQE